MYKIGIVSDTHGLLRQEVKEALLGCDVIFHAGDVNRKEILDGLSLIAPVYAVRGNNDKAWAEELPKSMKKELFGVRFFLIHNKKHMAGIPADTDIIIFGHTHKYEEKQDGSVLWMNPGSCGPRRFNQPITLAVMEIEDLSLKEADGSEPQKKWHIKRIDILPKKEKEVVLPKDRDMKVLVEAVIRDMNRGLPTERIAVRHQITGELAEQICRMYVTHPGVDVEGILNRIQK